MTQIDSSDVESNHQANASTGQLGAASGSTPLLQPSIPNEDRPIARYIMGYVSGLVVLGPWMPIVAMLLTLALYLGVPATHPFALLAGSIGGVVLWLIGAYFCRSFARPGYTNPTSYQALRSGLRLIDARLKSFEAESMQYKASATHQDGWQDQGAKRARSEALDAARTCACRLHSLLSKKGLPWLVGSGYSAGWALIGRAEEALMMVESNQAVLQDALYDKSRLEDSTIDGRDHALAKLRLAAITIVPEAAASFDLPQEQQTRIKASKGEQDVARAQLRDVRRRINDFRAERWEGLMRERNRLVTATLVTELLLYVLLALAIITNAPEAPVVGATAIFLVGAVVGLFNRLYSESKMNSAVDDYGLSLARLMLVPFLGGLSALGGVLLMLMLYGAFIGQYIQPAQQSTPSATATVAVAMQQHVTPVPVRQENPASDSTDAQSAALDTRDIAQIYDLEKDPYALLLAAVFGLAPASLVSMLQQQAKRYMIDLKSSQASVGSRDVQA